MDNVIDTICFANDVDIHLDCPVCGATDHDKIFDLFQFPEPPDKFKFQEEGCYAGCRSCGTVFLFPRIVRKAKRFADYGTSYYEQTAISQNRVETVLHHIQHGQQSHYNQLHEFLNEHFPASEFHKWLDVGSAGCPTVYEDYDFQTLEPDPVTVQVGRKVFKNEKIHNAIIENFETDEVFDGVVFLNSFYCTPTPREALERCQKLLRNGGVLVISVISQFMEVTDSAYDGRSDRLEDTFRGNALLVYYNRCNLIHLCEQFGLSFFGDFVPPKLESQERLVRYMVFKKADVAKPTYSLEDCREHQNEKIEEMFSVYEEESRRAFDMIAQENVAIFGTSKLIEEIGESVDLNACGCVLSIQSARGDTCSVVQGVRYSNLAELRKKIESGEIKHVVVVSYRYTLNIARLLISGGGLPKVKFYFPNRESGIESLYGQVKGERRFIKGLVFVRAIPNVMSNGSLEMIRGNEIVQSFS